MKLKRSKAATIPVGSRVGVILKADATTVWLLGYGVYDGDHVPPFPGGGQTWDEFDAIASQAFPNYTSANRPTNPKITLDDGTVVWGFQCWWGPEDQIQKAISSRKVINVTMADAGK